MEKTDLEKLKIKRKKSFNLYCKLPYSDSLLWNDDDENPSLFLYGIGVAAVVAVVAGNGTFLYTQDFWLGFQYGLIPGLGMMTSHLVFMAIGKHALNTTLKCDRKIREETSQQEK